MAGILVGLGLSVVATPTWKAALIKMNQSKFSELTFYCDNAMRGHLLAKQRLVGGPSEENVTRLKAAEIDLLQCQDYDLMRKRLIRWGLTENELSEMSLLAIEEKGQDLRDVIRVHEIRY
ncbi:TIGR03982 family His-Xaa-Ser system protein [Sulfitobacter pontiacus]|uniref:TIGR03982 family His-Xaa-Ser system protein n=1 Tax=Sulfitobacter pontiacus TaxID=60137 RepID=UPI00315B1F6B